MQKDDLGMKFKTIFRELFYYHQIRILKLFILILLIHFFLALTAAKIIYMFNLNEILCISTLS